MRTCVLLGLCRPRTYLGRRWWGDGAVLAGLGGTGEALLEQDGDDDDHALGNGLRRAREVVLDEDAVEGLEDQDAEDGADDRAPAAGEQGAADDDGGDGVELPEEAVRRGPARGPRGDHQRGDAAAEA